MERAFKVSQNKDILNQMEAYVLDNALDWHISETGEFYLEFLSYQLLVAVEQNNRVVANQLIQRYNAWLSSHPVGYLERSSINDVNASLLGLQT